MLRYFKPLNDRPPTLPKPTDPAHGLPSAAVRSANEEILSAGGEEPPKKKSRGPYGVYSGELRVKIGRFAAENGVAAARRNFMKELDMEMNESTIRGMKDAYLKKLKSSPDDVPSSLPKKDRGRPLLLGKEWDEKVKRFIQAVRRSGGCISTKLVLAGTTGLLKSAKPPILVEHGGSITIDKSWARSVLDRMGYSKRKGTKGIKHRPDDMDDISGRFHRRIGRRVRKFDVPDALVINWDQTAVEVVPASKWTMHPKGDKQVPIKGSDDKRQYTALLACALDGHFLPPQIIYQGKSDQCHPNVAFPDDWDVTHTESHWSNSDSMMRYLDNVICPYVEKTKERLQAPLDTKPLLIFDVYRAHRTKEFLDKLNNLGFMYVFIPAACTDFLQPLDATVNNVYKKEMQAQFSQWYSQKVADGEKAGRTIHEIVTDIDLRTSVIKPIHATWMMRVQENIRHQPDIIIKGFQETGILKAVADARLHAIPDMDDSDAEEEYWQEQ